MNEYAAKPCRANRELGIFTESASNQCFSSQRAFHCLCTLKFYENLTPIFYRRVTDNLYFLVAKPSHLLGLSALCQSPTAGKPFGRRVSCYLLKLERHWRACAVAAAAAAAAAAAPPRQVLFPLASPLDSSGGPISRDIVVDRRNIWCIVFFPVFLFWSPSLAADNHGAWVGLINCLAARNLVLNFPLFL